MPVNTEIRSPRHLHAVRIVLLPVRSCETESPTGLSICAFRTGLVALSYSWSYYYTLISNRFLWLSLQELFARFWFILYLFTWAKMIARVLSGSLLFVLVFSSPNGPFATRLDGNTDNSTGRPRNTSVLNQSNAATSAVFVPSFNKTGIALENGGIPGTGEEERTYPNVRNDFDKRIEDKDSTKNNTKHSFARETDLGHGYTRGIDTSTAFLVTSAILRQQDLETSHDQSMSSDDQGVTVKPQEVHTGQSSVISLLHSPSPSVKKHIAETMTSSRAYTISYGKNAPKNENTALSRKAAGITEVGSTSTDPTGEPVKRMGSKHRVLLSTVALAVDSTTPDFKTETRQAQAFGTATDDQLTQTDDGRSRKRDVNLTRQDVTKSEFAYKSLWDDEDTEDDEGTMEAEGGGTGRGSTSRTRLTEGAAEPGGSGKRMAASRGEDGRFTIPAELRRARNRNGQFH